MTTKSLEFLFDSREVAVVGSPERGSPETGSPQSAAVGAPPISGLLLDRAYDEFCQLDEAGELVRSEEFIGRYPTIRSSLARLIELHREVKEEALLEEAVVWPKPGDDFHGFHLERSLGTGATSRVFLAKETALGDRFVAVKVTRQGDAEAFTLGRVKHPNVIPILSRTAVPGQDLSIICMEYLGSATLSSLLDSVLSSTTAPKSARIILDAARDPSADAAALVPQWAASSYESGVRRFFAQVCVALEYLHARKILHRDLKPSNILMRPNGSPVLLDFNLARDLQGPAGRFGGTYPYMPPEQLRAMSGAADAPSSAVDERSDLFAVGVLLWETLTGKLPFGSMPQDVPSTEGIQTLLSRQRAGFQAPMPEGWSVSPELVALVRRCLAVDPAQRPATASELRTLLAPDVKPKRRGLWLSAASAVVVVGLSVAVAAGVIGPRSQVSLADHYRSGAEALQFGDRRKAHDEFTHVITAAAKNPRGWQARAIVFGNDESADTEKLAQASADLQRANNLDAPDFAFTGYLEQRQNNPSSAQAQYGEALKKKQATAAVNNNLSAILCNTLQIDEAIACADLALAENPDSQPALINRALARYKRSITTMQPLLDIGQKAVLRQKSLVDLVHALKVGPESGELHYKIANVMVFPTPIEGDFMKHLARAIDLGCDPRQLNDVAFRTLRGDPEFQKLAARAPVAPALFKMQRLIPPRTELPTWNP